MAEYHKKFISLDLETTHLDPKEGRIMEVGAIEAEVFFDEQKKSVQVKFGKSFSTLVNPEIEPSPQALFLTGITHAELKTAPRWRDVKPALQKFLGKGVLVGHNIGFDLEFLKNQDLKLKNQYLDTLELALTFLPLSLGHSLEYLAESLGLLTRSAHRAFPDSQASALLLAAILNAYLDFDPKLKAEIQAILEVSSLNFQDLFASVASEVATRRVDTSERATQTQGLIPPRRGTSGPVLMTPGPRARGQNLLFLGLPDEKPKSPAEQKNLFQPGVVKKGDRKEGLALDESAWIDQTLISLPLSFKGQEEWFGSLAAEGKTGIVGVFNPIFLEGIPQKQKIPGKWALCDKRLIWLKNQEKPPDLAAKILIKLLIFCTYSSSFDLRAVKWTPLEREFLPIVLADPRVCLKHHCGYTKILVFDKDKVYFSTLADLFDFLENWQVNFEGRRLLLFDLAGIEEEFAESLTRTWNLRTLRQFFSPLYPIDPQMISWFKYFPQEVQTILNEMDLFFGILHLVYLQREGEFAQNLVIDETEASGERFSRLLHPAEQFLNKLISFQKYLENQVSLATGEQQLELEALLQRIKNFREFFVEFFFARTPSQIYSLRFNSQWVDLNVMPRELVKAWEQFQQKFKSLTIVDTVLPELSLAYFLKRLGLMDVRIQKIGSGEITRRIPVNIFSKATSAQKLLKLLATFSGRNVIVAPNESKLLELQELLTRDQTLNQEILIYKFSGTVQSLKSRFSQSQNSILVVTLKAFLRNFLVLPPTQNLVIERLPFEAPGARVGLTSLGGESYFFDHALPRAVHLLHTMISRFVMSGEELQEIFLLDPRILRDYDQTFMEYLKEFPDFSPQVLDSVEDIVEGGKYPHPQK